MAIIFCLNKSFFIHYTSNFENSSLTQEVIFELVARGNSKKKKNFDFLLSCFSLFIYTFFYCYCYFYSYRPFPIYIVFNTCYLGRKILAQSIQYLSSTVNNHYILNFYKYLRRRPIDSLTIITLGRKGRVDHLIHHFEVFYS